MDSPNGIVASASIEAVADAGRTRFPVLRSDVPLVLRRTPSAVYLVGAAAGPLGGDRLSLDITVGAGAVLRLRTSAASVVLPGGGDDSAESRFTVTGSVGRGGRLEYLPEPVVVASGARHFADFQVTLEEGASLLLRDELILGRHGETGGSVQTRVSVSYGGRPLLRQALAISGDGAEGSLGPAVLAGHRAVGNLLLAGPAVSGTAHASGAGGGSPTRAVMPLAGPGVLVTALADDAVSLRRQLTADEGT